MAKKDDTLNPKQLAFVDHFIVSFNATDAAKKAGYSERSARSTASALLTKPNIQMVIDEKRKARELALEIKRDEVLKELGALAFTDFTDLCEVSNGEAVLKNLDELPRHMKKAVKKIQTRSVSYTHKGDTTTTTTTTVELYDKIKALELLGKHFGLFDADKSGDDKGSKKSNAQTILAAVRAAAARRG